MGTSTSEKSHQGYTNPSAAGKTADQKNSKNKRGVMSDSMAKKPAMKSPMAQAGRKKSKAKPF